MDQPGPSWATAQATQPPRVESIQTDSSLSCILYSHFFFQYNLLIALLKPFRPTCPCCRRRFSEREDQMSSLTFSRRLQSSPACRDADASAPTDQHTQTGRQPRSNLCNGGRPRIRGRRAPDIEYMHQLGMLGVKGHMRVRTGDGQVTYLGETGGLRSLPKNFAVSQLLVYAYADGYYWSRAM